MTKRKMLLLVAFALMAFAMPTAALAGGSLAGSDHLYNYGNVAVGTTTTATLTFTNVGSSTITVGEVQSTGFTDKGGLDFGLDFAGLLTSPSCFTGLAVVPGGSCTLSFAFAPSAIGRRWQQTAVVASDGSTARLLLVGTGT